MLAIAGQTDKNNSTFLQSAKLFKLVNVLYLKNLKARISTFSLVN